MTYTIYSLGKRVGTAETERMAAARAETIAEQCRTRTEVRRGREVLQEFDCRRSPRELAAEVRGFQRKGWTPEQISDWLRKNNYNGMALAMAALAGGAQ